LHFFVLILANVNYFYYLCRGIMRDGVRVCTREILLSTENIQHYIMNHNFLRHSFVLLLLIEGALSLMAVPAYRGWQTKTQPDGTTITVRLVGDEFYHYWETEDGKIAIEQADGTFVVSTENRPSGEQIAQRRMASRMYQSRPRRAIGTTPNLAPKGVVILANFQDTKMQSSHTQAVFDELCNSTNCTVNMYNSVAYGSAAQYFADQSNGSYRPQFDVFGPVTLSQNYAYYGEDTDPDDKGSDRYASQAVMEACILANSQFSVDFTQYDSDNDGKVDFVYVIYAGKGQADGGDINTIWPHNWSISSAIYYGNCTYTAAQCKLDGKTVDNYACSAELSGSSLSGIGTLCHEFGHVMGLPDLYDTNYGDNYNNSVTPGDWNIMDGGSYNGGGHCPPNYDPWEKYFFGWITPINLGTDGQNITLYANGASNYVAYQINSSNTLQAPTKTGTVYYLENRQKSGWDKYVPEAGMLVWKVDFNSSVWSSNAPNNTSGSPRYTIVPANGKTTNYGSGSGDTYPTSKVTSYTPITGHALTSITKSGSNITFKYNGGISGHNVEVSGTGCTIVPSATTVSNGTTLTVTITPTDDTYDFGSLTVKLGSTTLTSGTHFTLSSDKKTLTIKGSAITGADSNTLTITAVWTKNRCNYYMLGENSTEELSGVVSKNTSLNLTITPDAGYTLADAACWDVTMGGNSLTYGEDFTYNSSTNTFTIASVTGDVEIMAYGYHPITWYANGEVFATNIAAGDKITLPTDTEDCSDDMIFVGWCTTSNYENATTAPTFAKTGDTYSVANYYAVYAIASSGGGGAPVTVVEQMSGSSPYVAQTGWTASAGGTYTSAGNYGNSSPSIKFSSDGNYVQSATMSGAITTVSYWYKPQNASGSLKFYVSTDGTNFSELTAESVSFSSSSTAGTKSITLNPSNGYRAIKIVYSKTTSNVAVDDISVTYGSGVSYSNYSTTCAEVVKHTITWVACGETFKTEQVRDGAALVLPSPAPATNTAGKAFYGWIADENYTGTDAPATISAGTAVTADATYYAVYY